jgi:hypothetical protein
VTTIVTEADRYSVAAQAALRNVRNLLMQPIAAVLRFYIVQEYERYNHKSLETLRSSQILDEQLLENYL